MDNSDGALWWIILRKYYDGALRGIKLRSRHQELVIRMCPNLMKMYCPLSRYTILYQDVPRYQKMPYLGARCSLLKYDVPLMGMMYPLWACCVPLASKGAFSENVLSEVKYYKITCMTSYDYLTSNLTSNWTYELMGVVHQEFMFCFWSINRGCQISILIILKLEIIIVTLFESL